MLILRTTIYPWNTCNFMIHTESFTTKSVVSKPSSQLFTANQIRETTISRVEKTFCPITKNLSEVLGFRTFSSSCPFSLLETVSFVVGCVNILKGVRSSVVKFIS